MFLLKKREKNAEPFSSSYTVTQIRGLDGEHRLYHILSLIYEREAVVGSGD